MSKLLEGLRVAQIRDLRQLYSELICSDDVLGAVIVVVVIVLWKFDAR